MGFSRQEYWSGCHCPLRYCLWILLSRAGRSPAWVQGKETDFLPPDGGGVSVVVNGAWGIYSFGEVHLWKVQPTLGPALMFLLALPKFSELALGVPAILFWLRWVATCVSVLIISYRQSFSAYALSLYQQFLRSLFSINNWQDLFH